MNCPEGSPLAPATPDGRFEARGKFLYVGGRKVYLRGVTYGTFRPDPNDDEYPEVATVEQDFAVMAANGVNVVRTYTPPPEWLLDAAAQCGLHVMPSLALERVIGHLNDRRGVAKICAVAKAGFKSIAGHPALACVSLGNELPTSTVRWLGAEKVQDLLLRVTHAVREEDDGALVTFANYPSAEYLELPFLDVVSFNVYLEEPERFSAYVARLQQLAGARPLLMTEIGMDAYRNGLDRQAEVLRWQVRSAFEGGCAGTFVYSWTDEWHRGGEDVFDWEFGLTDRDRNPKPALEAVRGEYQDLPAPRSGALKFSVVVCAYNAAPTIEECLHHATSLEYQDYEVIVIDDGSKDDTAALAAQYPCRVVSTENRGLGAARNLGLKLSTGDVVAYLDSDAYPDPHWLTYLGLAFASADVAGVGGPNIPPPLDPGLAHCVANGPGGPCEVLLDDRVAEHIPGCNMAFRREVLMQLDGCDEQFRTAGDDVDLCWRVQHAGGTIGFHAGAVVWHHRRSSLRAYWRQQTGYGRAEALLEAKWPERYNTLGHVHWSGRIYGLGATAPMRRVTRIYQGVWGSAPFQSLYERSPSSFLVMPLMAEWLLVPAAFVGVGFLGFLWAPFFLAWVLSALALAPLVVQAIGSARGASFPRNVRHTPMLRVIVALLHLMQPVARLKGRLWHGLHPFRRRGSRSLRVPRPRSAWMWSDQWIDPLERLEAWERRLVSSKVVVHRNSAFDRWDLDVRCGPFGRARMLMSVEEHGGGAQLVRWRIWPLWSVPAIACAIVCLAIAPLVNLRSHWLAVGWLATGVAIASAAIVSCAAAVGALLRTVDPADPVPAVELEER